MGEGYNSEPGPSRQNEGLRRLSAFGGRLSLVPNFDALDVKCASALFVNSFEAKCE